MKVRHIPARGDGEFVERGGRDFPYLAQQGQVRKETEVFPFRAQGDLPLFAARAPRFDREVFHE